MSNNVLPLQRPSNVQQIIIVHPGRRVESSDGTRSQVLRRAVSIKIEDVDRGQGTQYSATPMDSPEHYAIAGKTNEAVEQCLRNLLGIK